jgi:hypothetical protein
MNEDAPHKNGTTNHPHDDREKERDALRDVAREHGLYTLVFYGHEKAITFVNRDKSPAGSHALPNETVARIDWEFGDWAVFLATASKRKTNPEYQIDAEPDKTFNSREKAVAWAAEQL